MEQWINRVIHADCMDILPQLEDKSIDMVLTDIPYNEVNSNESVNKRAKYAGQLRKFTKDKADILTFNLRDFLEEVKRVTKGSVYIFCGVSQLAEIFHFFKTENEKDFMARVCVWKKTNPPVANGQHMWLQGTEFCVFAKRRKTVFNEHCKSNVWEYPVGRSKLHPTQKPLELFEYLIRSSSNEGDVILDPCLGSGTTAVASINTNRNFIGIEKERDYYEIACKRIEEHKSKLYAN